MEVHLPSICSTKAAADHSKQYAQEDGPSSRNTILWKKCFAIIKVGVNYICQAVTGKGQLQSNYSLCIFPILIRNFCTVVGRDFAMPRNVAFGITHQGIRVPVVFGKVEARFGPSAKVVCGIVRDFSFLGGDRKF